MKLIKLALLSLIIGCTPKAEDFNLKGFVSDFNSKNESRTSSFLSDSLTLWKHSYSGKQNQWNKDSRFTKIYELQNLQIDSVYYRGDTIKGLFSIYRFPYEPCIKEDEQTKNYLDTNSIDLVISNEKIKRLLYYKNKRAHKKVVSVQSFYMDETEITSDEYKEFKPNKSYTGKLSLDDYYDSLHLAEKNIFKFMKCE